MRSSLGLGVSVLALLLSSSVMQGQTAARYRDFQLGSDIATVSAQTGVPASNAKAIHTRPALLQDLEWRRPYGNRDDATMDPAQHMTFSFYDNQLFRIVIDYDRDRTAGMSSADLVDAISAIYGTAVKPGPPSNRAARTDADPESGTRVAAWAATDVAAVLYQQLYLAGFELVVTSPRLDALARTAAAQAVRLDEREAPQRELAQQKKDADDLRAAQERARITNKATFKP